MQFQHHNHSCFFFTSHLFSISLLTPSPHQFAQHHVFASVPDIWLRQFAELHFIRCRAALGAADPATSLGLRVPLVRAVQQWFGDQAVGYQLSSAPSFFVWQSVHNGCCTIRLHLGAQLRICCTSQRLLVVKYSGHMKSHRHFQLREMIKNFHHWSELTWSHHGHNQELLSYTGNLLLALA